MTSYIYVYIYSISSNSKQSTIEFLGIKTKSTNEKLGLWLLMENVKDNNLVTTFGDINYIERVLKVEKRVTFCFNITLVKISGLIHCRGEKIIVHFQLREK